MFRAAAMWALALCVAATGLGCMPGRTGPAPVPAGIRQELDVVYGKGGDEDLKLDLYAPKNPAGLCPVAIQLHGGGWYMGSKEECTAGAVGLAQKGYVAVTVAYRLAPKNRFPAQIEDAKCAVRWLRAHAEQYHIDKDRFGVVGASAGGHLALLLGFTGPKDGFEGKGGNADQSSQVQVVVNWMGPTDLTGDWPALTDKMITDLIGSDRAKGSDAFKAASPLTYIHKGAPPVLTFHGTKDALVPYDQAKRLDAALRDAGVESQLETLEGKGHGVGLTAEDVVRMVNVSTDFLDKHLKPK
jgi:acetyl esterase/lipase